MCYPRGAWCVCHIKEKKLFQSGSAAIIAVFYSYVVCNCNCNVIDIYIHTVYHFTTIAPST